MRTSVLLLGSLALSAITVRAHADEKPYAVFTISSNDGGIDLKAIERAVPGLHPLLQGTYRNSRTYEYVTPIGKTGIGFRSSQTFANQHASAIVAVPRDAIPKLSAAISGAYSRSSEMTRIPVTVHYKVGKQSWNANLQIPTDAFRFDQSFRLKDEFGSNGKVDSAKLLETFGNGVIQGHVASALFRGRSAHMHWRDSNAETRRLKARYTAGQRLRGLRR